MDIAVYTLTSPLHDEQAVNAASSDFIAEIEAKLGTEINFRGSDFTGYGSHDLDAIYVRTGGTEGIFKEVYPTLDGTVHLLTSGKSNSLAASMEILSYLGQQGRKGEIIHGSTDYISERLTLLAKVSAARKTLQGKNLGIIGKPSDWLISSDVEKDVVRDVLGINLIDIPIEELIEAVKSGKDFENIPELSSDIPSSIREYADGAFRIYAALKMIVAKYSLSGLTLRCFDLLTEVENTGCLALALLNAEGIPSGCEGDVPTLITMTVGQALTGQCGFQSNPSRIDPEKGKILLAHCTIPLDMVRSYSFNTHFESGIGIAIHGEMPEGDVTVLKISGDMKRHFCCKADLVGNPYDKSLCRTQITLDITDNPTAICRDYFLKSPIGNHHVVFSGNHKDLFDAFFNTLPCPPSRPTF